MPTAPCAGVRGCLARAAAILLALLAAGANAQVRGVFVGAASEGVVAERSAERGQLGQQANPETLQQRAARLDFERLAAVREAVEQGQLASVKLNLFEDAEFDWIVERTVPTGTGYSLSGPLVGVESGTATLVANGDMVVGSAWTPEASYRIRTVGRTQIVERTSPSPSTMCERTAHAPSSPTVPTNHAMTDDGSEVDVLVIYTAQARRRAGGHLAMLAEIDHDVAWTNEAYAVSDVVHRVHLVGAVETDYWQQGRFDDIGHLIGRDDGHMDEVHTLRDSLAADVVVLKTTDGGIAPMLTSLKAFWSSFAFATAQVGSLTTFAHELGHVMGVDHDRGDSNGNLPFPYSHGYVLTGIRHSEGYEYSTIMHAGGGNLPRFSNPRQRFRGVPLGVPGDEPTGRLDGPADAARSMRETRFFVANYRQSSTRCLFQLSGMAREIDVAGGSYTLRVEADAGCAWTARSADGFTTIVSGANGSGDGVVTYKVLPNEGWVREVALAVAGRMHIAVQPGSRPVKPVCERSESIRDAIETELNAPCADISATELLEIAEMVLVDVAPAPGDFDGLANLGYLRLRLRTGTTLTAGTFDGLAGVGWLEIRGAAISLQPRSFRGLEHLHHLEVTSTPLDDETAILPALPPGTFDGLPRLRDLYYTESARRPVMPGLFRGLPELTNLVVDGPTLTHMPSGTFRGLPNLRHLRVDASTGSSPITLEAGVFDDLGNLETLRLNSLAEVPSGLFAGLTGLNVLRLQYNAFTSLPPGAFGGLSALHSLHIDNEDPRYAHSVHRHELSTLPPGLFRGLPRLEVLRLGGAGLTRLRPSAFEDVGATLRQLYLGRNRLSAIDAGTFYGLRHLRLLELSDNLLTSLPAGTLANLPRLGSLFLGGNQLVALPAGMFENMCELSWLELHGNRLTALPPSLFVCQNDEWLYLNNVRLTTPNVSRLTLHGNPGAPFTFDLQPFVASPPWQRPIRVAVRVPQGAPYSLDVSLEAEGGALEADSVTIAARALSSDAPSADVDIDGKSIGPVAQTLTVTPTGRRPVVVRIAGVPEVPGADCAAFVDADNWCGRLVYYTGIELAAGEPIVLNGVTQRQEFNEPAEIDLANVFLEFDGAAAATFTVRSSNPAVAVAETTGDVLRVVPVDAGTATITVTATAADGRTATRTFTVAATVPTQPRFLRGWRLALLNEGEDPP